MPKALIVQEQNSPALIQRRARRSSYTRHVSDLAADYLNLVGRKNRPLTVLNYGAHLKRFSKWLSSHAVDSAGKISPDLLKQYGELWIEHERAGRYKASTVNNHLNPVRGFLCWCIAEAAVFDRAPDTHEPWVTETRVKQWLADVKDTSRPTRKERALSSDEVHRLLSIITDKRDLALFTLLCGSGLRVSESCALRAGDITTRPDKAGIVHVIDGKGGKSREVVIAESVIRPILSWGTSIQLRMGDATDTRKLWQPHRGEGQQRGSITRIRIYQLLQDYAKKAKINRRISPHNLRHTYATERYRDERDPVAIADALGDGLGYVQTYVNAVDSDEAKPFVPNWGDKT